MSRGSPAMDVQQIGESLNAAMPMVERVGGVLTGGLGLWLIQRAEARRERKAKERAEAAKADAARAEAEAKADAAGHEQTRETRKDTLAEYDAIIRQKDADIAARDAAYKAYQKFAHERIDAAAARLMDMHAREVVAVGQMARFEERLKACDEDRAELWQRVKDSETDRADLRNLIKQLEKQRDPE